MTDLLRDSPFGQLVRFATRNRVFLYPEEKPGFQAPSSYDAQAGKESSSEHPHHPHDALAAPNPASNSPFPTGRLPHDLEKIPTAPLNPEKAESARSSRSSRTGVDPEKPHDTNPDSHVLRTVSPSMAQQPLSHDGGEPSQQLSRTKSLAIVPTRTRDGRILADW